jgi:hypothetical protein
MDMSRTTLSAHLNWADSSSTAQLLGHPAIDAETITVVQAGDNFVHVKGWIDPTVVLGPIHVSRLLPFDASRATRAEVAEFLAAEGQYIIARVIEHCLEPDGTRSLHLGWRGTPVTSWLPEKGLESNQIVTKYREANGLSSILQQPLLLLARAAAERICDFFVPVGPTLLYREE